MLVARVAPPLPDGELPKKVLAGAPSQQQVAELVAPGGGLLARRLAAQLSQLGYVLAWVRPLPFEVGAGSVAPLLVTALTAARRESALRPEPVVVVVESPTAAQAEDVLDELLEPGVPFGPSVVLIVPRGQRYRQRSGSMVPVREVTCRVRGPGVRGRAVRRLLRDASAGELASLEMARHLGYAHASLRSLEQAVAKAGEQPWWVPLTGGWWQVDPAWRQALAASAAGASQVARSACLSRLVAELVDAGAVHEGIELCVTAGWPGMAADLLAGEAETLLAAGRYLAVASWLERLPAAEARCHPGLAAVAGELLPTETAWAGPPPEPAIPAAPPKRRWRNLWLPDRRRWDIPAAIARGLESVSLTGPVALTSPAALTAPAFPAAPEAQPVRSASLAPAVGIAKAPPAGSMPPPGDRPVRIEARLLGQFELRVAGQPVPHWCGNRGRMLLAFLLLHRRRALSRDELGVAFWPDAEPEAVRNRLHVTLYGLRRDLRAVCGHPIVVHSHRGFSFDPGIDLWLDTEAFEEALGAARKELKGQDECPGSKKRALAGYEQAVQLYRGELLEDAPYEEWALPDRERLRLEYLDALDQVATLRFAVGQYAECLDACQRLLPGDLCREEIHRLAMRCYARLGQPHLAVRQYRQCERQLRDELGIAPGDATRRLYERIRRREPV